MENLFSPFVAVVTVGFGIGVGVGAPSPKPKPKLTSIFACFENQWGYSMQWWREAMLFWLSLVQCKAMQVW